MAGFTILTVTQIGTYLKSLLDSDSHLTGLYIKGEIADFRDHYSSGHIYFTLKDGISSLRAVMFQSYAAHMRFRLEDGMSVIVRGDIAFYSKDGSCQLYAYDAQPDGIGAKYVALEQLKQKLFKEGLFSDEHKRELPQFPECVGVVSSASGAALKDILHVLSRRWPAAEVVLAPVLVQGGGAASEIAEAVKTLNDDGRSDVIIVGRGGGSSEDLFAFNDEGVVRAVYSSRIPVVSAVGHETDYTLCDMAADMRAPTPSAAAEMVSHDMTAVLSFINGAVQQLSSGIHEILNKYKQQLDSGMEALRRAKADDDRQRCERLAADMKMLDGLSPLGIMRRGFAAAEISGKPLKSVSQLHNGAVLNFRLADGVFEATVTNIKGGAAN